MDKFILELHVNQPNGLSIKNWSIINNGLAEITQILHFVNVISVVMDTG